MSKVLCTFRTISSTDVTRYLSTSHWSYNHFWADSLEGAMEHLHNIPAVLRFDICNIKYITNETEQDQYFEYLKSTNNTSMDWRNLQ